MKITVQTMGHPPKTVKVEEVEAGQYVDAEGNSYELAHKSGDFVFVTESDEIVAPEADEDETTTEEVETEQTGEDEEPEAEIEVEAETSEPHSGAIEA